MKSESSRVQENLLAEVDYLRERTTAADRLLEKKMAEVGLRKGELVLAGSQATLALKKERRKKAEIRIAELKDETSR